MTLKVRPRNDVEAPSAAAAKLCGASLSPALLVMPSLRNVRSCESVSDSRTLVSLPRRRGDFAAAVTGRDLNSGLTAQAYRYSRRKSAKSKPGTTIQLTRLGSVPTGRARCQ